MPVHRGLFDVAAPVDMRAPHAAYVVFYALFAAGTVGTLGWMLIRSRRRRTPLPLAALGGGLVVGVIVPPIYDFLTLVWFPSNIPLPFVTEFGMKDPLFDALGYVLFIGFGGYLLYTQLLEGRGARAIYATFALWSATDLLLELPFLHAGLYRYYGDQPLLIGGFPLHWAFMNGLVPSLAGTLMYAGTELLPGSRRAAAWRVAACPALAAGLLMIPIFPVAAALHADVGSWVRIVAALVTIAISASATLALAAFAGRVAARRAASDEAGPGVGVLESAPGLERLGMAHARDA
ncbi:MAG: hypothetical protein JWN32_776 [Solirubrobacterales bacterium]|nr:hypothetical protein [Solirubrobacterales bacterium]